MREKNLILLMPLWPYIAISQNIQNDREGQIPFFDWQSGSLRELNDVDRRWNNITLTPQNDNRRSPNFVKGAVARVKNWLVNKPASQAGGRVGNTISGVFKGIGKIFRKPADKVMKPKNYFERRGIIQKLRGMLSSPFQKRNEPVSYVNVTYYVAGNNARAKEVTHGWAYARYGIMPKGVFVAGVNRDGKEVYVARSKVNQTDLAVMPGTLKAGRHCVRVAVGPWTRCIFKYQILIGDSYMWYPSVMSEKEWYLHPQSLIGGREAAKKGVVTNYICRTYKDMTLFIGKLHAEKEDSRYRKCIIPYKGKTETVDYYDILVDWWTPY